MSTFGAYTELPDKYPDLVTATEDARNLPGRENYDLVSVYLKSHESSQGLGVEIISGEAPEGLQEVVVVTVEEDLMGKTYDIPYVLVFEKEEENGENGNSEDGVEFPGSETLEEVGVSAGDISLGEGFGGAIEDPTC